MQLHSRIKVSASPSGSRTRPGSVRKDVFVISGGRAASDRLAAAMGLSAQDADLAFLMGVFLHFDGQVERARPFFQRAAQLAGGDAKYVKAFEGVPRREPAGPEPF